MKTHSRFGRGINWYGQISRLLFGKCNAFNIRNAAFAYLLADWTLKLQKTSGTRLLVEIYSEGKRPHGFDLCVSLFKEQNGPSAREHCEVREWDVPEARSVWGGRHGDLATVLGVVTALNGCYDIRGVSGPTNRIGELIFYYESPAFCFNTEGVMALPIRLFYLRNHLMGLHSLVLEIYMKGCL